MITCVSSSQEPYSYHVLRIAYRARKEEVKKNISRQKVGGRINSSPTPNSWK